MGFEIDDDCAVLATSEKGEVVHTDDLRCADRRCLCLFSSGQQRVWTGGVTERFEQAVSEFTTSGRRDVFQSVFEAVSATCERLENIGQALP